MSNKLDSSAGAIKGGHGGKREGAGRRKAETAPLPDTIVDDGFATRVLERIGEGKPAVITSAEDYQLDLLHAADIQTRSYNFNRLIDRKYGKTGPGKTPSDPLTDPPNLDFENLRMPSPTGDGKPRTAGKPN